MRCLWSWNAPNVSRLCSRKVAWPCVIQEPTGRKNEIKSIREKKKKVVFRFSTCFTFRDNDSTRIRVGFVSFILLTNIYRSLIVYSASCVSIFLLCYYSCLKTWVKMNSILCNAYLTIIDRIVRFYRTERVNQCVIIKLKN